MKKATDPGINFFQRYLTVWVFLCMVVGVLLGHFLPTLPALLARLEFARISIPMAILIWVMIYPMMLKVDFQSVRNVGKNPKGLFVTWIVNWLFSVHSRRYTLGEFYTEYRELSEVYQEALSTYEAKKQFVEQMIVMELLLEESGDKSATNDSDAHDMEELRVQYLWQILHQEEVDDDLDEPTEEEIRDFYEKNPAKLMTPASAEISLIWIDQGANTEKKEQAKAKAEEAMSLLNSGTSFAEVAKMYSEDSSAEDGGVISGPLYESHLAAELAGPIFSLKVGQVSKIIDYRSGYYIIQVRSRTEARLPELEEVSHTISDYLKEMEHETRTQQMEQQLLKEAGFTIYDKTLRGIMKAQQTQL